MTQKLLASPPFELPRSHICKHFHQWHPSSIFLITPTRESFSIAAATLSLSLNCLVIASAVLWVPSLIFTSTLKRGGRACSRRTRTPKPMMVASEQWVIVGVIKTVTTVRLGVLTRGLIWISGRLTTDKEPKVSGCSGSVSGEMRSAIDGSQRGVVPRAGTRISTRCQRGERVRSSTVDFLLVNRLNRIISIRIPEIRGRWERIGRICRLGDCTRQYSKGTLPQDAMKGSLLTAREIGNVADGWVGVEYFRHGSWAAGHTPLRSSFLCGMMDGWFLFCAIVSMIDLNQASVSESSLMKRGIGILPRPPVMEAQWWKQRAWRGRAELSQFDGVK